MRRRDVLRLAGGALANAAVGSSLFARAAGAVPGVGGGPGPYGPLQAPDANGLMLPAGFRSSVVARGPPPKVKTMVKDVTHSMNTKADALKSAGRI